MEQQKKFDEATALNNSLKEANVKFVADLLKMRVRSL